MVDMFDANRAHSEEVEDVRGRSIEYTGDIKADFIILFNALDDMRQQRDVWKDRFLALARAKP